MKVFEDVKRWDPFNTTGKAGFTLRSGREFFYYLKHAAVTPLLNIKKIDECFIASQMTILNEARDAKKYDYLTYVEFQEMLCRIAIVGLDPDEVPEPVAWKVQHVMEFIWDMYQERGIWEKGDENGLVKVINDQQALEGYNY